MHGGFQPIDVYLKHIDAVPNTDFDFCTVAILCFLCETAYA